MKLEDFQLKSYINFIEGQNEEDKGDLSDVKYISKCFFGDTVNSGYKATTKNVGDLILAFEEKHELTLAFNLNGVEYGFIPDLEDITFDELVDMDTYLPEVKDHHKLMAILYRPIYKHKDGKYRLVDYIGTGKRADIMLELPLNIYLGAIHFFEDLGKDLQIAGPSYSTSK